MTKLQEEHLNMVRRLKKDPQKIVNELTPERADFIHMAMGIASEAEEIKEALVNEDYDELLNELGDFLFFSQGICDILKINIDFYYRLPYNGDPHKMLGIHAGHICDEGKKVFAYNRDPNVEKVKDSLERCLSFLHSIIKNEYWNVDTCFNANMNKLVLAENARYKDGYSDEAAINRQDKQ